MISFKNQKEVSLKFNDRFFLFLNFLNLIFSPSTLINILIFLIILIIIWIIIIVLTLIHILKLIIPPAMTLNSLSLISILIWIFPGFSSSLFSFPLYNSTIDILLLIRILLFNISTARLHVLFFFFRYILIQALLLFGVLLIVLQIFRQFLLPAMPWVLLILVVIFIILISPYLLSSLNSQFSWSFYV